MSTEGDAWRAGEGGSSASDSRRRKICVLDAFGTLVSTDLSDAFDMCGMFDASERCNDVA